MFETINIWTAKQKISRINFQIYGFAKFRQHFYYFCHQYFIIIFLDK